MGSGVFNSSASAARANIRATTRTTAFTHDVDARAGRTALLHTDLDLSRKLRRESRDVAGKQPATPIAIIPDVTGSMRDIPILLIAELNKVMQLILEGKVVTDPQILFGAVGDLISDRVPLQMGEFEADDKLVEECLSKIFLEGAGGGQNMESYESILWYFGNYVETDAFDKRGEKGFLFLIGDEAPYREIPVRQLSTVLGIEDISSCTLKEAYSLAAKRFEIFLFRPGNTSHFNDLNVINRWREVLPEERIIPAEDWRTIAPSIAGTISLMAGNDLASTVTAMASSGFDPALVDKTTRGLIPLSQVAGALAKGNVSSTGGAHAVARRLS